MEKVQTCKALKIGSAMEEDDGDNDGSDVDMDTEEEGRGPFKDKVNKILVDNDYEQKRSSKLTQDDFLQLLVLFNKGGIHFA